MKILVVDDEKNIRSSIVNFLKLEKITALSAEDGLSAKKMLEDEVFDAAVVDLKMPGMDGLELLKWIQQEGPSLPVIMISAYGDINDAVTAMKLGAQDYIVKPFDPEELLIRLKRIVESQCLRKKLQSGNEGDPDEWIGHTPEMMEIKRLVEKVALSRSIILITGESGTGKEVVARYIHKLAFGSESPFIPINIGAVPEALLESELFGYEKGAFTGAVSRKMGLFEMASGGTLFLDEIGDMPVHLQVKLLRVLQERKIKRLGGTSFIPIEARIIAATNRDLKEKVKEGAFREDLFYRLNVIHIQIPPLRDRIEDIPDLVRFFIGKFNTILDKHINGIEQEALKALKNYSFPGNVRELENIIERAMILSEENNINVCGLGINNLSSEIDKSGILDDVEKKTIIDTLKRLGGNRTRAAKELGISRRKLQYKIKEYGVE
jgi:two-component system response regulator AtoC